MSSILTTIGDFMGNTKEAIQNAFNYTVNSQGETLNLPEYTYDYDSRYRKNVVSSENELDNYEAMQLPKAGAVTKEDLNLVIALSEKEIKRIAHYFDSCIKIITQKIDSSETLSQSEKIECKKIVQISFDEVMMKYKESYQDSYVDAARQLFYKIIVSSVEENLREDFEKNFAKSVRSKMQQALMNTPFERLYDVVAMYKFYAEKVASSNQMPIVKIKHKIIDQVVSELATMTSHETKKRIKATITLADLMWHEIVIARICRYLSVTSITKRTRKLIIHMILECLVSQHYAYLTKGKLGNVVDNNQKVYLLASL